MAQEQHHHHHYHHHEHHHHHHFVTSADGSLNAAPIATQLIGDAAIASVVGTARTSYTLLSPMPTTVATTSVSAFDALRVARHSAAAGGLSMMPFAGGSVMPTFLASSSSSAFSSSVSTTTFDDNVSGNDEYIIILPFIVLFGLCGNVISLVAIFHSRLRKMAANQYLIVLTTADSVFLLGVILVLFKVDFTGYFLCVGVEYVLMSASYVSSWSIAALTIERYLAIAHPLKHVQYGYVSRWRMMCFWVPLPFLLNLIQFVTLSPNSDPSDPNWPNVRKCTVKDGQLQMIVELIDVVLCYIVPCITVVVLNLLIASKVESAEKIFNKASSNQQKTSANVLPRLECPKISLINNCNSNNGEICAKHKRPTSKSASTVIPSNAVSSSTSSSGSTRILVVVPLVYILLNSPFYLFRIIDTIALNVFQCKAFSIQGGLNDPRILFLYNAAHYLYYVNFACDFVVYAFSSKNFRRTVVIAWRHLIYGTWSNQTDYLESMARNSYNRYTSEQRMVKLAGTNSITSTNHTSMICRPHTAE